MQPRVHAHEVQRVAARAADARAVVVADEQHVERRGRGMRSIGVAVGLELLDAQVGRARRERHLVAGEPGGAERRDAERDRDDERAHADQRALHAFARAPSSRAVRLRAVRFRAVEFHAVVPGFERAVVDVDFPAIERRTVTLYAVTRQRPDS